MANAAGDRATDLAGAGIVVGAEAMGKAKRFGAQVMGDERVQSGLASLTKFGNKAKQTAGKIAADAKARARLDEPSDVSLSWPTRQAPSPSEGRGDPADGASSLGWRPASASGLERARLRTIRASPLSLSLKLARHQRGALRA